MGAIIGLESMLSPSLRSFHDKVYVLTTPGATERQAGVVDQLGRENFSFVYGVDKQTVTMDELILSGTYDPEAASRSKDRVPMTLGEICCAAGHRMIYLRFLESAGERALIFEDDVFVKDTPEAEIARAIRKSPADAELIYWGWLGKTLPWSRVLQQGIDHVRTTLGLIDVGRKQIRDRYMRRYNRYFYTAAWTYLAHAYSITRSGAEKVLELNTPIVLRADHVQLQPLFDGSLRGYAARTQLFGQRSIDDSDPMQSMTRPDIC